MSWEPTSLFLRGCLGGQPEVSMVALDPAPPGLWADRVGSRPCLPSPHGTPGQHGLSFSRNGEREGPQGLGLMLVHDPVRGSSG